jgi:hypothetical protein
LIKKNDAGGVWIEELAMFGAATTAGSAMKKHHRKTAGRTAFFKINRMTLLRTQKALVERFVF